MIKFYTMTFNPTGLYTDLYQLSMGQSYYLNNTWETPVSFDYFFRKSPFNGGYVIFAGLADVLQQLESLHFHEEDITYLKAAGFHEDYLKFLKDFKFRGHIYAPPEGEVVFPTAPVLRVEGTILEVQLVESLILNYLNFESLIATKASRIRAAAGDKVLSEFGLRRSQGLGSILASRASIIGGFDATSNVYAAKAYQLKCVGTMAHSFVQMHPNELTAFEKFVETNPNNTTLLVDTYDSLQQGIPNAIKVGKAMAARGQHLQAIRLDSGDLAFLAHQARRLLDEAGLSTVKIVASNQLDEYVIRSLRQQEAPIDIFGVGTSLVTAQPDAALDGVFKLAEANHQPRIKISENIKKTTLPGRKQVYRMFAKNGFFAGTDAIAQVEEGTPRRISSPFDAHKSKSCEGLRATSLLQPVMTAGKIIELETNINKIKTYAQQRLALLPDAYKRFENPHIYKVGISDKTREIRAQLRKKHTLNS